MGWAILAGRYPFSVGSWVVLVVDPTFLAHVYFPDRC